MKNFDEKYSRPTWHEYFLNLTDAVALRADCRRGKYGAVLVNDRRVISTGYNGSIPGGSSCLNGECPRGLKTHAELPGFEWGNNDYSDCISLHAEANCIAYADGDKCRGATIYINSKPCDMCEKLIRAAGIKEIIYRSSDGEICFRI
jgi:dCMP deaminase